MNTFSNLITANAKLLILIVLVITIFIVFNVIIKFLKKKLLKKAKKKKQISNIKIFTRILQIVFSSLVLLIVFFSYTGSWTGLGVVAGLLTAALGFALQRPITGIAAWIMVVLKRPFEIGDRIVIGDVKGVVYDISLTHVFVDEIGGEIESDQRSGRNIMIPNHLLFEHNIINYTLTNDYIMGEVLVDITYESNLDKIIKMSKESVNKFTEDYINNPNRRPSIRVKMAPSAMTLMIRFFTPIKIMQETKSDITKDIYHKIQKEKDIEIAYPHSEIIFKDKNIIKKE